MFEFCLFEIKYRLKHISTYVFLFVLCGFSFLANAILGGLFDESIVGMFFSDKVALNSPYVISMVTEAIFSIAVLW